MCIRDSGLGAIIHRAGWPVAPLFNLIQQQAAVADEEMFHVFNMGLGMLVIVAREQADAAAQVLGEGVYRVGEIVGGEQKVEIR